MKTQYQLPYSPSEAGLEFDTYTISTTRQNIENTIAYRVVMKSRYLLNRLEKYEFG